MAVRFDAQTDRYKATTGLPTGTAYTVSFWLRLSSDPNATQAILTPYDAAGRAIYVATATDGTTLQMTTDGGGSGTGDSLNLRTLTVGAWYRLALVVNGVTQTLYHGADSGALTADTPGVPPGSQFVPDAVTFAGADDVSGGAFLTAWLRGDIANIKVHNAALTAAEVELELAQHMPVRASGLLRWHPLVVSETVDYSGGGNSLTAGSTATATIDGPPLRWARSRGPRVRRTSALTVEPTFIASAETVYTPTLVYAQTVTVGAMIPTAEAVYTPAVAYLIAPPFIASAEAVYSPRITLTIAPGFIASAEQVYALVLRYTQTISPPLVATAETVYPPDLTVTLDPAARIGAARRSRLPRYEALVMARVPQPSGPPTLFDVDAIAWSRLSWTSILSRAQSSRTRCSRTSITEPVAQRLRAPLQLPTELWVLRNGSVVAAGPLLGVLPQGRDEVELVAGGLLTYLDWMWLEDTVRYDQVDQFAMAANMVDRWQATEFGHFGIDTSQVGTSGRLRDATYERDEGHQVSRRIEELGARRDGFDTEVDPATRRLQLWYPQKGIDRSASEDAIVFDARNVDAGDGMSAFGPGDVASDSFGSGSSAGADATLWSHQPNLEMRASFGRTGVFGSWSDVSEQATLDDHVAAQGAARAEPLRAPGRRVKVTPDSDLASYDVGDTVQYELDRLLGIGGAFRIRSRTVDVVRPGVESVDLEFV
jgi:hypothetical protein